jgi:prophage regulatory protein
MPRKLCCADGACAKCKNKPQFPRDGLVRLKQILGPAGPIPVSKSTWWDGVKDGRFPEPTPKISKRVTTWRARDIWPLIENSDN